MRTLKNAKHEAFAQELAQGKTASEAYVLAGYKESRAAASRLSANVDIRARVAAIQNRGAVRAEVTIASILEELEEARSLAIDLEQPGASVAATMGKAKVAGLLIDKAELSGKDGGPIITATDAQRAKALAAFVAKTRVK